jgi:hypothetical protein
LELEKMSAEYRPVPTIPFHSIDARLEKHGIKLEFHGATTALIGARGTLFATSDGNSTHFERKLGVDAHDVLEAIEAEYSVGLVDENDCRFWGGADDDQLAASNPYTKASESWILIEGPSLGDAKFVKEWVEAAQAADEALMDYFRKNPVFGEDGGRIEIADLFEFTPCAMALLCWWINDKGVFGVNLLHSVHAEAITVMAATGFLTRVDHHYWMSIPRGCNISPIMDALLQFVETGKVDGPQHFARLLTTMTQEEMCAFKCRLKEVGGPADRNSGLRKIRLVCSMGRKIQSDE